MKSIFIALLFVALVALVALVSGGASAQQYIRIPTCGTASPASGAGPGYMDANGNICSGTSTSSPSYTIPGPLTWHSLAYSSVVSGTPQTVLAANLSLAGGFIYSATTNTGQVCINQNAGTAGTSTSGDTTCFSAGATGYLAPTANAVSVNCSTGTCTFSGAGLTK